MVARCLNLGDDATDLAHDPRSALREDDIQRAVFAHIRTRGAPGVVAFHPKNGGIHQRGRRRGINAGLGVVSGVSDIIAFHNGNFYALELKAEGRNRPTEEQLAFQSAVDAAGGFCAIAYGLDRALACLEAWGLLRGTAA